MQVNAKKEEETECSEGESEGDMCVQVKKTKSIRLE